MTAFRNGSRAMDRIYMIDIIKKRNLLFSLILSILLIQSIEFAN